jgi:Tat protein translocase TatB subunit
VFNVGGPEVLVILFLALIVLGPQRLPDAARQVGKFMGELRRMSNGFQQELKTAFDEPTETAAREKGAAAVASPAPSQPPPPQPIEPVEEAPAAAEVDPPKKAAPRKRAEPLRAARPAKK